MAIGAGARTSAGAGAQIPRTRGGARAGAVLGSRDGQSRVRTAGGGVGGGPGDPHGGADAVHAQCGGPLVLFAENVLHNRPVLPVLHRLEDAEHLR